ncbi:hypothetical protein J5N97_007589 [Dioscorea zingiberensis]|uniref:Protein kinase domain-containing protein n=1 Tax=Dioscorea zingiberensis TaxID=325984 RepID=A0A9D5DC23_9LILI|nr:hypothetical protein J5N97_007589 [Dioscorea zingiberensis]
MNSKRWIRGQTLGHGSFSTVSLASFPSSGAVLAVKSTEASGSASSSLLHEQRILSSLHCLNIISYAGFDVTTELSDGRVYYNLFMEYAAGGSLSDEIKSGPIDEASIRDHVAGILSGLTYLHSLGYVHCDVKPENILIGDDGRTKLGDLGCAKVSGDEERCLIRGTPMFMAPEVARGEEQGPTADVWALGCTFIEMATGRRPWPEISSPLAVLNRIAFSSELPEIPGWLSGDAKDFLAKCLIRDSEKRWTAEQLLQHPFVASCVIGSIWSSPKSTLNQEFWDLISEDDEQEHQDIFTKMEMEMECTTAGERLRELAGDSEACSSSLPNWSSWDEEDWILVRSNAIDDVLPDETSNCSSGQVVLDSLNSSCFRISSVSVDCTEMKQYSNSVACDSYSHSIKSRVLSYIA